MPSTVVHVALAGLIGAALLGDAFDRKAMLVVLAATAFPDLDSFVPLVSTVGHRAALHTFVIPLLGGLLLYADVHWRSDSFVLGRWGPRGLRVAWVGLLCYAVAGIALDFTRGVVNPFWPLYDQYFLVDGTIELSSRRGIVQTFVDLGSGGDASSDSVGSSSEVVLDTGVNPQQGPDEPVDRVFPVVRDTWELVVLLAGTAVTAARFRVDQAVGESGSE